MLRLMPTSQNEAKKDFLERSTRWLLLLTLIHTIPVIWITPVAGGTAPTAGLLVFLIASLWTFDTEGIALGLMVGLPALIYCAIAWLLAWLIAKGLCRLRKLLRIAALAALVLAPLLAVYFPIYVAGGHSGSSSIDLISLLTDFVGHTAGLSYWIALHVVLALLFASQFLSPRWSQLLEQRRRPALAVMAGVVACVLAYTAFPVVICRPLAELGSNSAQVCVARSSNAEQRYWYERAARDGHHEAIVWMIDNTPNRQQRLEWIRKGAESGDPASQYRMYEHLQKTPGTAEGQAMQWLRTAAQGGYAPAQVALAEELATQTYRTKSLETLAERNAWLERAAEQGSRFAMARLAQNYARGSMGYPIDQAKAREYYQILSEGELTPRERKWQMSTDGYAARVSELDAWQAGLDSGDPATQMAMAKLFLGSQFPGPGVSDIGRSLLEQAAERDPEVREELMLGLRTGTGGVEKDMDAARQWLLRAAKEGDPSAMERVADSYMKGRDGFVVDYPEARRWTETLLSHYQNSNQPDAGKHLKNLQNQLKYIARLDEMAGGKLLNHQDLNQLEQGTDAESHFQFALQLLAGHGAKRRQEALARMQKAADMGHGEASWRLVHIYERGFPAEINAAAARRELQRAVNQHHFYATRELASRLEYGKNGFAQDLPRAIAMYEMALEAGNDNRYQWNLDPTNFNHFKWLESRLRQARGKLDKQVAVSQ